jgi:hypothetical protein
MVASPPPPPTMVLAFELRASCLQSRCSAAWVTPPVHFALIVLEMGGNLVNYLPGLASNHDPPPCPISATQVAKSIGVSYWHPTSIRYCYSSLEQYLSCDWLISLSIMSFRFIHVVTWAEPISQGWIIFNCIYLQQSLSSHSSIDI